MRQLVLLVTLLATASGCATLNFAKRDVDVLVENPITLHWGIKKHNPGHLLYQHDGIPGNLATIPRTLTPQNQPLAAIILGDPLPVGDRVAIHILGVHEQVSRNGLISTIIATTNIETSAGLGVGTDFESLENKFAGALGVIEAGLVRLQGSGSRSLGFRSEERALQTISRYRQSYRSGI